MILELGLEVTVPQADRGEKAEADGLCLVPGLIALVAGDVLLGHNEPRPKDVLRDQHRPSSALGRDYEAQVGLKGSHRVKIHPVSRTISGNPWGSCFKCFSNFLALRAPISPREPSKARACNCAL